MTARRFVLGCIAWAATLSCWARQGEVTQSAALDVLDTCIGVRLPDTLNPVDTVIRRLSSGVGGNLNTTPRGATFILR